MSYIFVQFRFEVEHCITKHQITTWFFQHMSNSRVQAMFTVAVEPQSSNLRLYLPLPHKKSNSDNHIGYRFLYLLEHENDTIGKPTGAAPVKRKPFTLLPGPRNTTGQIIVRYHCGTVIPSPRYLLMLINCFLSD